MHMAKSRGRRSFVQFLHPCIGKPRHAHAGCRSNCCAAVERGEFELHYQPQNMHTGALSGRGPGALEAPHRGLVSPDEFIGFAENRA